MNSRHVESLYRHAFAGLLAIVLCHCASAEEEQGRGPVRPELTATLEGWRNTHGGLRTGSWLNSLVSASVEVDGGAVRAPQNSRFVAQVNWVRNRNDAETFASYTGASSAVSGIMAGDHVRVYNLYFGIDGPDGRWSAKIGQLAADDDFMLSEFGGLFLNASFGAIPAQIGTPLGSRSAFGNAFAIYPVAAPGIWVRAEGPGDTSFQAGVYHGGPGPDEAGNFGFEYASLRASGVLVFSEMEWTCNPAGRRATAHLGIAAHTGRFDDLHAASREEDAGDKRGLYSLYWVNDVVLVPDGTKPRIGAFTRIGFSPQQHRAVVLAYGDAGLNWFGAIRGRESDVLGLAVSATRFSNAYRMLEGRAATETTVELTYKARVTERLSVQADAQLLLDPARKPGGLSRDTAVVFGCRTALSF